MALGNHLQQNRSTLEAGLECMAEAIQGMNGDDPGMLLTAGTGVFDILDELGRSNEASEVRRLLLDDIEGMVDLRRLPESPFRSGMVNLAMGVADDHAVRGEFQKATGRWMELSAAGLVDDESLRSRMLWGLVAEGRPLAAQLLFAEATLGEADIERLAWLRDHVDDLTPLVECIKDMHERDPQDLLLVRLLAAVSPERALEVLKTAAQETDDPEVRADLVEIAMATGPQAAIGTAAETAQTVDAMQAVVSTLLEGPHGAEVLLDAALDLVEESPNARPFVARLCTSLERPDLAWALSLKALEDNPGDRLARVEALRAAGRLREPQLINQVSDVPADPFVESARVVAFLAAEEYDTAQRIAEQVVAGFPESPEAYEARARVRASLPSERALALEDYLAAIRLGRHDALAWLGVMRLLGGEPSPEVAAALSIGRNAIPEAGEIDRLLQAEAALEQGRFAEAERILIGLADSPTLRPFVLQNLFLAWRRLGRLDTARTWFINRVRNQPAVTEWRRGLAWVNLEQGRVEEVILGLREAAAGARSGVTWGILEEAFARAGIESQGAEIARIRLERHPEAIGRTLSLARLDVDRDPESALARLIQVAESDPTLLQRREGVMTAGRLPQSMRGQVMPLLASPFIDGRVPSGARDSRVLIQHLSEELREEFLAGARPDKPSERMPDQLWLIESASLASEKDFSAAANLLAFRVQSGINRSFPDPSSMLQPMLAYAVLADWTAAEVVSVMDMVAESGVNPGKGLDAVGQSWLLSAAGLASTLGREDTSIGLLELAYAREPDEWSVMNNLGFSLLEEGRDRARAAELIGKAISKSPNGKSELDSMGWLRYRQGRNDDGDPDGALAYLDRSIDRRAMLGEQLSPEVLLHVGDASWRGGRLGDAVSAWNAILESRGRPGLREQYMAAYSDWLKQNFGSEIVDPMELWQGIDARWVDAARARVEAVSADQPPPLVPTWSELDEAALNNGQ